MNDFEVANETAFLITTKCLVLIYESTKAGYFTIDFGWICNHKLEPKQTANL
jgi:hypothetical protein